MTATLRTATSSDLDLLVLHRRRMWEDMGMLARDGPDPSEGTYRAWLAAGLASGTVTGWVAEAKGEAVGSGLLWFQDWHPRPQVPQGTIPYLLSMHVDPNARRKGIARAITQEAIAAARAAGHPRLALHASEAGRPLYSALGFRQGTEMVLDLAGKA